MFASEFRMVLLMKLSMAFEILLAHVRFVNNTNVQNNVTIICLAIRWHVRIYNPAQ